MNELKSEYRDDTVRIHVHLKNDIMVGKKKTKDVQVRPLPACALSPILPKG